MREMLERGKMDRRLSRQTERPPAEKGQARAYIIIPAEEALQAAEFAVSRTSEPSVASAASASLEFP